MKCCTLVAPISLMIAGCTTLADCDPCSAAPSKMILSRGSAFYEAVEYIRLEESGRVSIHDPDQRTPIYTCLRNEDWSEIRDLFDRHNAAKWGSRYNASETPSDGATHIVIRFSDLNVDTYDRMGSAPKWLGIDAVYEGVKSVALHRIQKAEQVEAPDAE